jgi:hypothetical protein
MDSRSTRSTPYPGFRRKGIKDFALAVDYPRGALLFRLLSSWESA